MTTQADQSYVYNVLTLYSLLSSMAAAQENTKHDLYIRSFGRIICIHLISTELLLSAKYLAKHSGHKHTGVCFHGTSNLVEYTYKITSQTAWDSTDEA